MGVEFKLFTLNSMKNVAVFRRAILRNSQTSVYVRNAGTNAPIEELGEIEIISTDSKLDENTLKKVTDISRLKQPDKNMLKMQVPFEAPIYPQHFKVLYHRRMLGKFGIASGVNPGVCWPTKQELTEKREYEAIAYPYDILEVANREAELERQKEIDERKWDEEVALKVSKLEVWKKALQEKKDKIEREREAAQAKRNRLIAEVKEHFNYTLTEKDEKFHEEVQNRIKQRKEELRLANKERKALKKKEMYKSSDRQSESTEKTDDNKTEENKD